MTAILISPITGKTTYTAQWRSLSGVSQGVASVMNEGAPGVYSKAAPSGMPASTDPYVLEIKDTLDDVAKTLYYWDGTKEIDSVLLRDRLVGQATEIATIKTQSKLAAARVTNRIRINSSLKTETLYDDNGTTPLVTKALKGSTGLPDSEKIYEVIPQ